MEIRKIQRMNRRGSSRRGLKLGKKHIQEMSFEDVRLLKDRIRKNTGVSNGNKTPGHNSKAKHAKKLIRKITLIRRGFFHDHRKYFYRESEFLEHFITNRGDKWIERKDRKKKARVRLNNFSFIDNPKETIAQLTEVVKAEAQAKSANIDFIDQECRDIAPYIVLGLVLQEAAPVFEGGLVSAGMSDVLHSVNLLELLKVGRMKKADSTNIFAFPISSRRKAGSSFNDNLATSATTEEKVSGRFVETFNQWLSAMSPAVELTEQAYAQLGLMFGELLNNAKRHSDTQAADGEWHIAGFMQAVPGGNPSNPHDGAKFICQFSIISMGETIYESMQHAPEDIKKAVLEYTNKCSSFKTRNQKEALWTACAMQDGISRIHPTADNEKNGFGIMQSLVALMNIFGETPNPATENEPIMTIVSGTSCVMVKYPYNRYRIVDGKRILAFNAENTLDREPDANHVLTLPVKFPGTITTVRFVMDNNHLTSLVGQ
jgi:hypothetical protein